MKKEIYPYEELDWEDIHKVAREYSYYVMHFDTEGGTCHPVCIQEYYENEYQEEFVND